MQSYDPIVDRVHASDLPEITDPRLAMYVRLLNNGLYCLFATLEGYIIANAEGKLHAPTAAECEAYLWARRVIEAWEDRAGITVDDLLKTLDYEPDDDEPTGGNDA